MSASGFAPRPAEGLNFANAAQMFVARAEKTPELTALRHKVQGTWRGVSWRAWDESSREIAAGLIAELGLEAGDRVAIMARTRIEWVYFDLAIAMAGAVSVPIYPTVTGEEATFILQDADCKLLVVDDPEQLRRAVDPEHADRLEGLAHVVYFDDEARRGTEVLRLSDVEGGPPRTSLAALRRAGAAALDDVRAKIDDAIENTGLEDEFTIVYTSGTTGRPKGVVLVHRNIVYEAWAIKNSIAVDRTDATLLILPLAHIFARHMVWAAVQSGATTAFAESDDRIPANLREVAPTYVGGVPRVFEKMHTFIFDDIRDEGPVQRRVFDWALDVGRKVSACKQRGESVPTALALRMAAADRALFERIRNAFGGRLRFFVSGAAPLDTKLAEFFHAAGILILEGYGLTETTGATNVNRPDRFRFGTVGPALPGCEVSIGPDGEVLIRGHNVMARYHGLEEETAEVIDEDGWLHTGDLGELSEGFLRITGRKKHIIITAGGKNIPPLKIERQIESGKGISHAMVYGDARPYLVALITLDEGAMMAISERERLGCRSYGDLVRHPRIRALVQHHVDAVNATLPSYETIKKFAIPPLDFSEPSGELTPTQKIKRKVVLAKYGDLIESLYESVGGGPPTGTRA
jgi:long-chain acyl-CoA synthetase